MVKPAEDISPQVRYMQSYLDRDVTPPVPTFPDRTQIVADQNEARRVALEAEKAKAAQLAAEASASVSTPLKVAHTGDGWEALRQCESGGNYATNTGNGYYGAYQYDIGTWANYGGYARPDLAPPAVQDAKAQETFAARGSSPWPVCGRFL